MRWSRLWLTLVYSLATLVAMGVHDHRAADAPIPESHGDCDESRLHVAGHEVISPGDPPAPCPSCQFRSHHTLWRTASSPAPGPGLTEPVELGRASTLPGSPLRTSCRAPPLV
ncbi:hypothetical protein P12x_001969 [Tundrisphaera lichenicola]|uniref:hypothetical protein n=1 Tax=Tundrisphaera lichenicola TaxID=2029860 RepID=UPI003EB81F10